MSGRRTFGQWCLCVSVPRSTSGRSAGTRQRTMGLPGQGRPGCGCAHSWYKRQVSLEEVGNMSLLSVPTLMGDPHLGYNPLRYLTTTESRSSGTMFISTGPLGRLHRREIGWGETRRGSRPGDLLLCVSRCTLLLRTRSSSPPRSICRVKYVRPTQCAIGSRPTRSHTNGRGSTCGPARLAARLAPTHIRGHISGGGETKSVSDTHDRRRVRK